MSDEVAVIDRSLNWTLNTVGVPDGPEVEVPYIGRTPSYLSRPTSAPGARGPAQAQYLTHHVPLSYRGPYVLDTWPGILGEHPGHTGRALCSTKTKTGTKCKSMALNRSGLCGNHGGKLHPYDKRQIDWDQQPRELRFKYGKLPYHEMTDEELAKGMIRKADGNWDRSSSVTNVVHQQMLAELYKRSDELLRTNMTKCVEVFIEVATNDAFEPADRLRAAEFVFTRVRGKLPEQVVISQDKPFEQVLTHMLVGGSRADSRMQRGVEVGESEILDVEEVDQEALTAAPPAKQEYDAEAMWLEGLTDGPSEVQELVPDPPKRTGPAGAPQYGPPRSTEERQWYEAGLKENQAVVDEKRKEYAAKRKEHKKKMHSARAAREWTKNEGYKSMAVPLEVEEIQEQDGVRFRFHAD